MPHPSGANKASHPPTAENQITKWKTNYSSIANINVYTAILHIHH
jgi:hypothetical protein